MTKKELIKFKIQRKKELRELLLKRKMPEWANNKGHYNCESGDCSECNK